MAKIDLVTQRPDGTIVLVLVQADPWVGSREQLSGLQQRLNEYLSFALDGHLANQFPDVAGNPVEILIQAFHSPDPVSRQFIDRFATEMTRLGLSLRLENA